MSYIAGLIQVIDLGHIIYYNITPHLILLINFFRPRSHDTGNDNVKKSLRIGMKCGMKWKTIQVKPVFHQAIFYDVLRALGWNEFKIYSIFTIEYRFARKNSRRGKRALDNTKVAQATIYGQWQSSFKTYTLAVNFKMAAILIKQQNEQI